MTLTQLEYIIAVDTYKHFSKAAKNCYITQPTLSMQILKLEEELGVTIFDRTKHPTIATEIGKQIIEQARIILQESKKINEIVRNTKTAIEGELRLGVIPTLAPYLLPLFINGFLKKYPVSMGSVFAKSKKIKISDIKNQCNLWVLNKDHCFSSQVINLCSQLKKIETTFNLEYQSGSLETLIKLVDSNGDLTLLPELAADELPKEKKKLLRSFADISPVREVSIITHRSFVKKELIEILKKEIMINIPPKMKSNKRGQIVEWK